MRAYGFSNIWNPVFQAMKFTNLENKLYPIGRGKATDGLWIGMFPERSGLFSGELTCPLVSSTSTPWGMKPKEGIPHVPLDASL